ncbi:MAG: hypothetical protein KBF49_05830 [Flavobacteriales bacterium]|jgi:hypothetical protein|nr:hypothetical protein [Flavobacteriales bacterium]
MLIRIALLFFFLFLNSLAQAQDASILGAWVRSAHQPDSTMSIFVRARKMKPNKMGYELKANGVLLARMNSSGCAVIGKNGRSQSFLGNVQGEWKLLADKRILMTFKTFMGFYEEEAVMLDGQFRLIAVRILPSSE